MTEPIINMIMQPMNIRPTVEYDVVNETVNLYVRRSDKDQKGVLELLCQGPFDGDVKTSVDSAMRAYLQTKADECNREGDNPFAGTASEIWYRKPCEGIVEKKYKAKDLNANDGFESFVEVSYKPDKNRSD